MRTALPGTKIVTVDHPTNGLHTTRYAVELLGHDEPIVLAWTTRKTAANILSIIRNHAKLIVEICGGDATTEVEKRKGVMIFDIRNCKHGYSVACYRTIRELHGASVLRAIEVTE